MTELMIGVGSDLVPGQQRQLRVHHQARLGVQAMADPAQLDRADLAYPWNVPQRRFGSLHQAGVDGVHQAPPHFAGGVA